MTLECGGSSQGDSVTIHVDPVVGKCSEGEGEVCMEGGCMIEPVYIVHFPGCERTDHHNAQGGRIWREGSKGLQCGMQD